MVRPAIGVATGGNRFHEIVQCSHHRRLHRVSHDRVSSSGALQMVGTQTSNKNSPHLPGAGELILLKYSKSLETRCAGERNGVLKRLLRKGCHVSEFSLIFRRSGIDGSCRRQMATPRDEAGQFGM
jgi:hypothetical protein